MLSKKDEETDIRCGSDVDGGGYVTSRMRIILYLNLMSISLINTIYVQIIVMPIVISTGLLKTAEFLKSK